GIDFVCEKDSTDFWPKSNDVKKIPRDGRTRNAFGLTTRNTAEISRFFVGSGEMLENGVIISRIKVVGQRTGVVLSWPGRFVENHDPVGVRVWKRSKQDRVDDAK